MPYAAEGMGIDVMDPSKAEKFKEMAVGTIETA
jgi:hypothetical protein